MRKELLALAVLAGGLGVSSAADTTAAYRLELLFTNKTPSLVLATGLPTVLGDGLIDEADGTLYTDGAGKISGFYTLSVTNVLGGSTNGAYAGQYLVNANGSLSTTGAGTNAKPLIKISLKGSGYATNGAGSVASSLNLSFTSTNGVVSNSSVAGPFTNAVKLVKLNLDGSTNAVQNYSAVSAYTNVYVQSDYASLKFVLHTSASSLVNSDGTNNYYDQDDAIDEESVCFGTPLTTAISNVVTVAGVSAVEYPLGYWIEATAGQVVVTNTYVWGLSTEDVAGFIAALQATNTYALTNGTQISLGLAASVTTNDVVNAYSNTNSYAGWTFSSSWKEIPGVIKGFIKCGKHTETIRSAAQLSYSDDSYDSEDEYYEDVHFIYTTYTGEDGVVVTKLPVPEDTTFEVGSMRWVYGSVLQCGRKMSLALGAEEYGPKELPMGVAKSKPYEDGAVLTGNATLTTGKKGTTYKGSLRGAGASRGSSLAISGTSAAMVTGIQSLTNLVAVTNLVSPTSTYVFTNTGGYDSTFSAQVAYTNVVSETNIYQVSSSFYLTVPGRGLTNSIQNVVQTMTVSGKIYGQKIPATTGVNEEEEDD
jgi:hypothetical protein